MHKAAFSTFRVRILFRPAVRLSDLESNYLGEFPRIAAYLSARSNSVAQDGSVCSGQGAWDVRGAGTASHSIILISTADRTTGRFTTAKLCIQKKCLRAGARWRTDRLGASQNSDPFQPTLCTHQPFTPNSLSHFLLFSAEQLLLLAKGTFCNKGKTTRRRNFVSRPRNSLQYLDRPLSRGHHCNCEVVTAINCYFAARKVWTTFNF